MRISDAVDDEAKQPLQDKVNDCDGDQREKRLIGPAAHDVAHLGQILHGYVANDGGRLDEGHDLAL